MNKDNRNNLSAGSWAFLAALVALAAGAGLTLDGAIRQENSIIAQFIK